MFRYDIFFLDDTNTADSYNNIFAVMTKTFAFGSRGMLNNKRLRKMNLHERTNVVLTLPWVVPFFFTSHY